MNFNVLSKANLNIQNNNSFSSVQQTRQDITPSNIFRSDSVSFTKVNSVSTIDKLIPPTNTPQQPVEPKKNLFDSGGLRAAGLAVGFGLAGGALGAGIGAALGSVGIGAAIGATVAIAIPLVMLISAIKHFN